MMKKILLMLSLLLPLLTNAQTAPDSLTTSGLPSGTTDYKFRYKQLILPSSMLLIGYMGVQNGWLRKVNREARNTFRHHLNNQSADNYLQYLPLACDYGLSALGIKAKHNYGERTIALATSTSSLCFRLIPVLCPCRIRQQAHQHCCNKSFFHRCIIYQVKQFSCRNLYSHSYPSGTSSVKAGPNA